MRNKSDMQTHFGKKVFKGETFCRIYFFTATAKKTNKHTLLLLPAGCSFLPASVNREGVCMAKTNSKAIMLNFWSI